MNTLLVRPDTTHLPGYADALKRGWSPNTTRPEAADEELRNIQSDTAAVLRSFDDPRAKAGPVLLPDGTTVKRLPGLKRFIWDNGFCGIISLRWQPGTTDLPPHCLGHIGFSVVAWRQRRGYASRALAELLPRAQKRHLSHVDLSTDVDNIASQKVIAANGGTLINTFQLPAGYGNRTGLLFRIVFPA